MGCLLSSAREANGLSKISNPVRTAGWAAAPIEAIERRMETADIGAPPVLGTGCLPQQEQCVCLPEEEEGPRMQDKTIPESVSAISRKLALLPSLPINELKQRWRSLYSSEPPLRVSRELLIRAVAYGGAEKLLKEAVSATPENRLSLEVVN
jgi:hypothetical protein